MRGVELDGLDRRGVERLEERPEAEGVALRERPGIAPVAQLGRGRNLRIGAQYCEGNDDGDDSFSVSHRKATLCV